MVRCVGGQIVLEVSKAQRSS